MMQERIESSGAVEDARHGVPGSLMRRLLDFLIPVIGDEVRRDYQSALALTWFTIPILGIIVVSSMAYLGIGFDAPSIVALTTPVLLLPLLAIISTRRFDIVLSSLCGAITFVAMISPLVVMFTYTQTGIGAAFPLVDQYLARIDGMMGFDWKRVLAWTDAMAEAHPMVNVVLKYAYGSLIFQMFYVIMLLSFTGQYVRLQSYLLAFVISVVIAGTICTILPAVGAYEFHGIDASMHPHLDLSVRNSHLEDYLSLRAGTYEIFSMSRGKGIITFPSYHATISVMFAWAFWKTPYVRWVGIVLNAAMLAATPLYGSHFLVDVIVGAAVAPVAIAMAVLMRRQARRMIGPVLRLPARQPV